MCNYRKILTITLNMGLLTIADGHPHYCSKCKQTILKKQQQIGDPVRAHLLEEMEDCPPTKNLLQCTCGDYFDFENEEIYCPKCRYLLEKYPEKKETCDKCGHFFYEDSNEVGNCKILCVNIPKSSAASISCYSSQPIQHVSKIASNSEIASVPSLRHNPPLYQRENSTNIRLKKICSCSPRKKKMDIHDPNCVQCPNCQEWHTDPNYYCDTCRKFIDRSYLFPGENLDDESSD